MTVTTVFGPWTLSSDSGGWDGYTFRQSIEAVALSDVSGDRIRVTLRGGSSEGLNIVKAYIQKRGVDRHDFLTTPVQLTFNGGSAGVLIPAATDQISDWVELSTDGTDDIVISVYVSGSGNDEFARGTGASDDNAWGGYVLGDDAATVDVSGYDEGGTLHNAIVSIEVERDEGTANTTLLENLTLTNPGAETGDATGWTSRIGNGPKITYDPGFAYGGDYYFAGATSSTFAWWEQEVSFPASVIDEIEAGQALLRWGGFKNGFSDADASRWVIEFLDAADNLVGYYSTDFTDLTGWTDEHAQARIPETATKARLGVQGLKYSGTELSSYLDNLYAQIRTDNDDRHDQLYFFDGTGISDWTVSEGVVSVRESTERWGWWTPYGDGGVGEMYRDIVFPGGMNTDIAAGNARLSAFCMLGNFSSGSDQVRVWAEWLDNSNAVISQAFESSPTPENITDWWQRFFADVAIPTNAKKLRFHYRTEGGSGSNDDGYMSQLSVFGYGPNVVPEAGIGGGANDRRRAAFLF